jgi:hypothetical protein
MIRFEEKYIEPNMLYKKFFTFNCTKIQFTLYFFDKQKKKNTCAAGDDVDEICRLQGICNTTNKGEKKGEIEILQLWNFSRV